MVITLPVIKLRKKKKALITFVPGDIPVIGKLLTPKATPFLVGAATLPFKGLKFAAKAFLGTAIIGGILQTSPTARGVVVEKIKDPTKIGRGIGEIIEDPTRLLPKEKTIRERVAEVVKKAGIPAGIAAAVVGAAVAVPKAAKRVKEKFFPAAPQVISPEKLPADVFQAQPVQVAPQIQPVGVVQPAPTPKEVIPVAPALPSIKNVFKPSIEISFRKSRKLINQQNIFR